MTKRENLEKIAKIVHFKPAKHWNDDVLKAKLKYEVWHKLDDARHYGDPELELYQRINKYLEYIVNTGDFTPINNLL